MIENAISSYKDAIRFNV